jgi:hypothetical protein
MKRAIASCFIALGIQSSPVCASDLVDSARNFHQDTSNIHLLMNVVGKSRILALKGCPSAIELIIRSYNAYIYKEMSNTSFMDLARHISSCK